MAKQTKINTPALYVNTDRGVALLNLSQAYYKDTYSLVNSDELLEIIKLYLDSKNPEYDDDAFDNATPEQYVQVLKKILIDDDSAFDKYDPKDILASVEDLYSFYRSLLRVTVINYNNSKIAGNEFKMIDGQLNDLVREAYRVVEEKLQGSQTRLTGKSTLVPTLPCWSKPTTGQSPKAMTSYVTSTSLTPSCYGRQ